MHAPPKTKHKAIDQPIIVLNLGAWREATRRYCCDAQHWNWQSAAECRRMIEPGQRHWRETKGGYRICQACATTPYVERHGAARQLADPTYQVGDLVDYLDDDGACHRVTPEQAALLRLGVVALAELQEA